MDEVIGTNNYNVTFTHVTNITDEDEVQIEHLSLILTKGFLLMVIILATIGGNVLVLLAVFQNDHLKSATNYFIANLALADLLLGFTVLPFSSILELKKKWFFGEYICTIWVTSDVLCCTASIYSLCVISVDRYVGVTKPLTYSTIMTKRKAKICCLIVWCVSGLVSVGQMLGFREISEVKPYECPITETQQYVMFSVLGSFYVPSAIILFVYWKIYVAATKHSKFLRRGVKVAKSSSDGNSKDVVMLRVHTGGQSRRNNLNYKAENDSGCNKLSSHKASTSGMNGKVAKFKRQKKAAKTLGIVVGVYVLCWSPFFIILPIKALGPDCTIPQPLFDFAFWLGYCNSCLNPIIYAFSSRELKKAFKKILKSCCCCSHRNQTIFSNGATRNMEEPLSVKKNSLSSKFSKFHRSHKESVSFEDLKVGKSSNDISTNEDIDEFRSSLSFKCRDISEQSIDQQFSLCKSVKSSSSNSDRI